MTGALNLYEKALTSYYAHMFEKTYEEVAHLVHVTMGTVQDQWLTNDEEGRDIIRAARKNCLEVVEETLKFELR
jgi:uncharacterized protein (UPF0297 family)